MMLKHSISANVLKPEVSLNFSAKQTPIFAKKGVEPELVIQERSLQQQLDAIERRRVELYNTEKEP